MEDGIGRRILWKLLRVGIAEWCVHMNVQIVHTDVRADVRAYRDCPNDYLSNV